MGLRWSTIFKSPGWRATLAMKVHSLKKVSQMLLTNVLKCGTVKHRNTMCLLTVTQSLTTPRIMLMPSIGKLFELSSFIVLKSEVQLDNLVQVIKARNQLKWRMQWRRKLKGISRLRQQMEMVTGRTGQPQFR